MVLTSVPFLARFTSVPCRRVPFHTNKFFYAERTNPDPFWKKRKFLHLAAHHPFRTRYCNKLTRTAPLIHMAREHEMQAKRTLQKDIDDLNFLRIEAGAKELDFDAWFMTDALVRSHVHVSQDILADLAIWEPRTFRSLVAVAADRAMMPREEGGLGMDPCGPGTPVNIGPT